MPDPAAAAAAGSASPPILGVTTPREKPLSLDEAIAAITAAATRGEVADALIGYSRSLFDVAALLVVREDYAFGWRGFGPDLDLDRLETLMVPLEAPSIFRAAVEVQGISVGAAPPNALHAHLFKVLRVSAPPHAVVAPISIRDRVVNLLYGQRVDGRPFGADVAGLEKAAKAAAEAYVRLIALQKKS